MIALARKTGAWIVPVSVAFEAATELKTWDAMAIPHPFCGCVVRFAAPFQVAQGVDEATAGAQLEGILNRFEEEEAFLG